MATHTTTPPAAATAVDPPSPRRRRRRLHVAALAVVGLALLTSLAANVALYRLADANYRRLSEAQLDPFGLKDRSFPPDAPAGPAAVTLPAVVFLGDSRARGWPPPPVPGLRFVNRGIGGQTTAQVLGRFDVHVRSLAPRVVVLQAGINDLKAIGLFPHRRAEIVADCKANLRAIIARAAGDGATVVVTTIFPTGPVTLDRRPVWSPDVEAAVAEVNADLRTLAGGPTPAGVSVVLLDAWRVLADGDGRLRDGYGVDTLHLSPRGYEALNAALADVLRTTPADGASPSAGSK